MKTFVKLMKMPVWVYIVAGVFLIIWNPYYGFLFSKHKK